MTTDTVQTRPMFLKVLCILSFIGCGITIVSSIFMLVFSLIYNSNDADQLSHNSFMYFSSFYGPLQSLKELIIGLGSLTGVILMWRLQKIGFFIYLIAESFLYFEFIYAITTNDLGTAGATQVGLEMCWPLPFDIAFFIMYAIQLKHMNKKLKTVTADT